MKHYAVIGNPIAHSKSPDIHRAFAEQCGLVLTYEAVRFEREGFSKQAQEFFVRYDGANVTVPFKEDAACFVDVLSDEARMAGAVNTLQRSDDGVYGYNTDGVGLVRDIHNNHEVSLEDKRILLIGAGGAARGVILPILQESPSELCIVNRTHQKAIDLAQFFTDCGNVCSRELHKVNGDFDIVINATSASLSGDTLPIPKDVFVPSAFVYDMMYGSQMSDFLSCAQEAGCRVADGLGMLVEQAAESFYIWHGVRPSTPEVINDMRKTLAAAT